MENLIILVTTPTAKQTFIEKLINKALERNNNKVYTFSEDFNNIILNKVEGYGKDKKALKSFLEDLRHGGCISGMIGDFVFHSDCKDFYVKHIDDLEEYKEELEEILGQPIENRHKIVHYTFVVWMAFEEYCYELYNNIFEN